MFFSTGYASLSPDGCDDHRQTLMITVLREQTLPLLTYIFFTSVFFEGFVKFRKTKRHKGSFYIESAIANSRKQYRHISLYCQLPLLH
jgi:hypothetical protein